MSAALQFLTNVLRHGGLVYHFTGLYRTPPCCQNGYGPHTIHDSIVDCAMNTVTFEPCPTLRHGFRALACHISYRGEIGQSVILRKKYPQWVVTLYRCSIDARLSILSFADSGPVRVISKQLGTRQLSDSRRRRLEIHICTRYD